MFETSVAGNKDWAQGFLTADDIRLLEDYDCEIRIRYLQERTGSEKVRTYDQFVDERGSRVPTHCEHGIPLYRKCGVCRALLG